MLDRSWPLPSLTHLVRLTDDCGVIQHAKFWLPDYANGYCADDNSRALIVAKEYYRLFNDDTAHELMVRYLAFLFYAQRPDGRMRNFIGYGRTYLEDVGSPDSLGRTLWGLGHIATLDERYLCIPAREMFHEARKHITADPHALAYAILGLCAYGQREELREEAQRLVQPLVNLLLKQYRETRSDGWDWVMKELTYGNARFPEAFLATGELTQNVELLDAGLSMLQFLDRVCFQDGCLSVVGSNGWYPQGGQRALFDQQPIDAGAMAEANILAYAISGDAQYLEYAVRSMDWFYGDNIMKAPLFDVRSLGCCDGLLLEGVNLNQGAESTLAYLMAQLRLYQVVPQLFARD